MPHSVLTPYLKIDIVGMEAFQWRFSNLIISMRGLPQQETESEWVCTPWGLQK